MLSLARPLTIRQYRPQYQPAGPIHPWSRPNPTIPVPAWIHKSTEIDISGFILTEIMTAMLHHEPMTGEKIYMQAIDKKFLALIVIFSFLPWATAADNGYKVTYDGGSLPEIKAGTGLKLFLDAKAVRLVAGGKNSVTIPASAITEVSYGQDVHRRVGAAIGIGAVTLGLGALMALTKSKKHFVGITWADGDKRGGLAMQCDKRDYRGILAGLEGISGKKAVNSDTMSVKN